MAEQQGVTFYREQDADPDGLSGQAIAVVGYGNLGRSMALNLRDSGLAVTVGNVDDDYRATARADGFQVSGVAEAVATADVVYVLVPDEVIPEVFRDDVAPRLRPGACVCFASGYVVAYGLVDPPEGVDVLLLAPRMLGEMARTLQAFADNGFFKSVTWHGLSAVYGSFLRTTEIDMEAMQRHFGELLADIQSGGFARRFQDEQANGYPTLAAIRSITSGDDPMTHAEQRVREALAPNPDH